MPRANGVRLDFREEIPEINKYWLSVSNKYKAAKYVSVVLLVAFLIVMLLFYRENITYANLVYLARDLDSEAALEIGGYSDIEYERSFDRDYELFRGRVAAASTTGFALYSTTGGVDLSTTEVVAHPRLEAGNKYALMYSAGDKKYSLYTGVARVLSAETEYEIEDAAVSDSGSFALLTRSKEYRFVVTVYNEAFRCVGEYYKNTFVMDLALDKNGDNMAMVSAGVDGVRTDCEIVVVKVGTEEEKKYSYSGMMPLAVEYTEDGRIVVLTDTALLVLDKDGEVANVSFGGLTPSYFDIGGESIAITFPANALGNRSTFKVYDTDGNEVCSADLADKIVAVATDGREAAYAVGKDAHRLDFETGKCESAETDLHALRALAVPGGLLVFTPENSRSFFFDK